MKKISPSRIYDGKTIQEFAPNEEDGTFEEQKKSDLDYILNCLFDVRLNIKFKPNDETTIYEFINIIRPRNLVFVGKLIDYTGDNEEFIYTQLLQNQNDDKLIFGLNLHRDSSTIHYLNKYNVAEIYSGYGYLTSLALNFKSVVIKEYIDKRKLEKIINNTSWFKISLKGIDFNGVINNIWSENALLKELKYITVVIVDSNIREVSQLIDSPTYIRTPKQLLPPGLYEEIIKDEKDRESIKSLYEN